MKDITASVLCFGRAIVRDGRVSNWHGCSQDILGKKQHALLGFTVWDFGLNLSVHRKALMSPLVQRDHPLEWI